MELSRTSPLVISTARILPRHSSLFEKNIKTISKLTKISCKSKRCCHSQNNIPPFSKLDGDQSSLNLFYKPTSRLPNGRKVIPLAKANGNQIGPNKSALIKVLKFSEAVLPFLRPPVALGYAVAFGGIMTRTWIRNAHLLMIPKWALLLKAVTVLVACVCTSCFAAGINQIYDIEIDKINKPHHPLASEQLSIRSAWIVVISSAVIGIAIPLLLQSQPLLASNLCTFTLASLYSIPPVSTKRSSIGAVVTCAALWYTFSLGMAATARNIIGLSFQFSMSVMFITTFSALFTFALGALKDIEDLEGDKKKVAFFSFGLILLTYGGAIAIATLMPQVFRRSFMVPTHIFLATYTIIQAWKLEKANYSKKVRDFGEVIGREMRGERANKFLEEPGITDTVASIRKQAN